MDAELADLDFLIAEFDAALAAVPAERLDVSPADGGWSAREVLAHLVVTVEGYASCLEALLARDSAAPRGQKSTWFARFLRGALERPGRRYSAPRAFRPTAAHASLDVSALLAAHQRLRAAAAAVQARGLTGVRFGTPVGRLLRLDAVDAVRVQVAHGRRHLAQMQRALQT
ncbi:MAG: DinB family protein [Planctomycetota bacterium]|nr:DinB family protein [Planctomycetota bacterium]